jgi:hypothetical protein
VIDIACRVAARTKRLQCEKSPPCAPFCPVGAEPIKTVAKADAVELTLNPVVIEISDGR